MNKQAQLLLLLLAFFFVISSCKTVYVSKPLPPGQAKKITGSQSAKPYAPGQQKKGKTVVVVTNQ